VNANRGAIIAFGILGLLMLAIAGITASRTGSIIGMGGDYDMPPAQVKTFVQSAATRHHWETGTPTPPSSLRKSGEEILDYSAPLLPWMTAHVTVRLWPERAGTHVEISGQSEQVKTLKRDLDDRLPALGAP
jgi:hypothetical protein